MGLTDADHQRLLNNLNPPITTPTPTTVTESTTIGNELTLRGIPVVGAVGGAIFGTRPGIDNLAELQRAEHELHSAMMAKARANLKRKN